MTPNSSLLYSEINALLSLHQRSFLLQQMKTSKDPWSDIIQRMRDLVCLLLSGVSQSNLSPQG